MKKKLFFLFTILLFFIQCDKDDDSTPSYTIRDYSEQVILDHELLEIYLKTHTYNYEDFNNESDVKIKLDTITENSSRLSLFDQANIKTVDVTDTDGQVTSHNLYYIIAREGSNINPSVADSVYVAYNGILTDGSSFDSRRFPIWVDLANTIEGFREGVSELRTGKYIENSNGTIQYNSFGVGLFFMPSGIGYFENVSGGVPEYSPLIFAVKLMTHADTDHDNDGILSIFEDIDGDNRPFGDDTDGDNLWNMYDVDDDGDGVLTVNEIDKNNDSVIDDTNNDGIPDYLDPDN
tara:strand:+ start:579 stop:1454 length:876 start_codon:yes stop_codon:yes gene_type:complete